MNLQGPDLNLTVHYAEFNTPNSPCQFLWATGRWAGGEQGNARPSYQRRGLPLLADAHLCGLREADDRGLEGAGHGGRRLPSRALDGATEHHGSECGGGLRGRWLLLALLDEGRGVGGQLSQGGQAPLGGKTDMGSAGSTTLPLTQKHTTLRICPSVGVGLQRTQCQHPTLSLPLGRVALTEN